MGVVTLYRPSDNPEYKCYNCSASLGRKLPYAQAKQFYDSENGWGNTWEYKRGKTVIYYKTNSDDKKRCPFCWKHHSPAQVSHRARQEKARQEKLEHEKEKARQEKREQEEKDRQEKLEREQAAREQESTESYKEQLVGGDASLYQQFSNKKERSKLIEVRKGNFISNVIEGVASNDEDLKSVNGWSTATSPLSASPVTSTPGHNQDIIHVSRGIQSKYLTCFNDMLSSGLIENANINKWSRAHLWKLLKELIKYHVIKLESIFGEIPTVPLKDALRKLMDVIPDKELFTLTKSLIKDSKLMDNSKSIEDMKLFDSWTLDKATYSKDGDFCVLKDDCVTIYGMISIESLKELLAHLLGFTDSTVGCWWPKLGYNARAKASSGQLSVLTLYLIQILKFFLEESDMINTIFERHCMNEILLSFPNQLRNKWGEIVEPLSKMLLYSLWAPHETLDYARQLLLSMKTSIFSKEKPQHDKVGFILCAILQLRLYCSEFKRNPVKLTTEYNVVLDKRNKEEDASLREIMDELGNKRLKKTLDNIVSQALKLRTRTPINKSLLKQFNITSCNGSELENRLATILAMLCAGVNETFHFWPRTNQIAATALLLLPYTRGEGQLLQIATGEGKSCVIAMFAAALAVAGQRVDIVTSSPVLADRDNKEWRPFYTKFGLTAACNLTLTEDNYEKCYGNNVVYVTVDSFAGDILREEFEMKPARYGRGFDSVIADEVDLMTLDQGVQFTYLSHRMAGIHHIEPVLAIVWSMVKQYIPVRLPGNLVMFAAQRPIFLFDAVLNSPTVVNSECDLKTAEDFVVAAVTEGLIEAEDGEKLVASNPSTAQEAWNRMSKKEMIDLCKMVEEYIPVSFILCETDSEGNVRLITHPSTSDTTPAFLLLTDGGLAHPMYEIEDIAAASLAGVDEYISYGPNHGNNKHTISLPPHLKPFVTNRLPAIIENAFVSVGMQENRVYNIDNGKVSPIDFKSSGVIEKNKKWGDGLQQFLEIKHNCRLSPMSLVTNFKSNIAFFKHYINVYGVSGTIGTDTETEFFKREYDFSAMTLPTHKKKKIYEMGMLVVPGGKNKWKAEICRTLKYEIAPTSWGGKGRAALVICEDIKTAKQIKEWVEEDDNAKVILYTQGSHGQQFEGRNLSPGEVVVATNLAGRGTDIKVSTEVNQSGGLFVLVTFLPINKRVEQQAFGRTARKGAPGSAQIVVSQQLLPPNHPVMHWSELKEMRDLSEKQRIEAMMIHDVQVVALRSKLFAEYCKFLSNENTSLANKAEKDAVLNAYNETWGLWLQINDEKIEKLLQAELLSDLRLTNEMAKGKVQENKSPSGNVYHLIKFGGIHSHDSDLSTSLKAYTMAIEEDPHWSAFAYYNRACLLIKQQKHNYMSLAMADLNKAVDLLKHDLFNIISMHQILSQVCRGMKGSQLHDYFQKRIECYNAIIENAHKASAKLDELKANGHDAIVEESSIMALWPNEDDATAIDTLQEAFSMGLERIFEVKKKPTFNFNAFGVFILGVLQVIGGAVLTFFGFATPGLALITEGVSDCITGIQGMATGEFSWAEWGMEKGISIAISLATGGIGKLATKSTALLTKYASPAIKKITDMSAVRSAYGASQRAQQWVQTNINPTVTKTTAPVKKLYDKSGKVLSGTYERVKAGAGKAADKIGMNKVRIDISPVKKSVMNVVANESAKKGAMVGMDKSWEVLTDLIYDNIRDDIEDKVFSRMLHSLQSGHLAGTLEKTVEKEVPQLLLENGKIPDVCKEQIQKIYKAV